jgi:nitrogen fixation protein NifB
MPDPRTVHPCFDREAAAGCGRVHLPVAPSCNIACNYCNRQSDCPNESRPGLSSALLGPHQALAYMHRVMEAEPRTTVVGFAGPGDPLANVERVFGTMRLIRSAYPGLLFCLSTNGLNLPDYLDDLVELNVSHVTVTVNSVDPAIGAKIHGWVRQGKLVLRGEAGAERLLARQLEGIEGLKARGMIVKVNTVVVPGINDQHANEVARTVAGLGADIQNLIPLKPSPDTPFADLPEIQRPALQGLRQDCGSSIEQMTHCQRCRADAVGLLGQDRSAELGEDLRGCSERAAEKHEKARHYVAVASREGKLVNLHLGQAEHFQIWDVSGHDNRLIEVRQTPAASLTEDRWSSLARTLDDCQAVLATAAGERPRQTLQENGIALHCVSGLIEDAFREMGQTGDLRVLKGRRGGIAGGCATGTGDRCG